METLNRTVALVGRPNVGKSRLFNRLVGRRVAIVHDRPGVTRDVAAEEITEGAFTLMDTGGIGYRPEMTPEVIQEATESQVDFAIQAAALVVFVCDGLEGLTSVDVSIAERLRLYDKPTLLVVNKTENLDREGVLDEFSALGLSDMLAVSAEHGHGERDLRKAILNTLGPVPESLPAAETDRLRICLCGKPNVGKSSIGNQLLDASRMIVSEVAGTTRDVVQQDLDYTAADATWRFRLIDTAGVKPKRKFNDSLDYFSDLRSKEAIENAQVALLILDAMTGVTKHDKKLAGDILEAGVGLIVIVNKWDYAVETFRRAPIKGYDTVDAFRQGFVDAIRKELFFLPDSPILFTSALTGEGMESLLKAAWHLGLRLQQKLPTPRVNGCVQALFERNQPRIAGGRRFKIYYAVQVANYPFKVRAFCNRKERLDDSYFRYLQAGFQREFHLSGCPVHFDFVGKPRENPYYERREGVDAHARNTLSKHGKAKKAAAKPKRKSR